MPDYFKYAAIGAVAVGGVALGYLGYRYWCGRKESAYKKKDIPCEGSLADEGENIVNTDEYETRVTTGNLLDTKKEVSRDDIDKATDAKYEKQNNEADKTKGAFISDKESVKEDEVPDNIAELQQEAKDLDTIVLPTEVNKDVESTRKAQNDKLGMCHEESSSDEEDATTNVPLTDKDDSERGEDNEEELSKEEFARTMEALACWTFYQGRTLEDIRQIEEELGPDLWPIVVAFKDIVPVDHPLRKEPSII